MGRQKQTAVSPSIEFRGNMVDLPMARTAIPGGTVKDVFEKCLKHRDAIEKASPFPINIANGIKLVVHGEVMSGGPMNAKAAARFLHPEDAIVLKVRMPLYESTGGFYIPEFKRRKGESFGVILRSSRGVETVVILPKRTQMKMLYLNIAKARSDPRPFRLTLHSAKDKQPNVSTHNNAAHQHLKGDVHVQTIDFISVIDRRPGSPAGLYYDPLTQTMHHFDAHNVPNIQRMPPPPPRVVHAKPSTTNLIGRGKAHRKENDGGGGGGRGEGKAHRKENDGGGGGGRGEGKAHRKENDGGGGGGRGEGKAHRKNGHEDGKGKGGQKAAPKLRGLMPVRIVEITNRRGRRAREMTRNNWEKEDAAKLKMHDEHVLMPGVVAAAGRPVVNPLSTHGASGKENPPAHNKHTTSSAVMVVGGGRANASKGGRAS